MGKRWGTPKWGEVMANPHNTVLGWGTPKCGERMETPKCSVEMGDPNMWGGDGIPIMGGEVGGPHNAVWGRGAKSGIGMGDPKIWGGDGDPKMWGEGGEP